MNIFVGEDEYTYYLHLYILGHETFCCVEDENTYYIRLYILGCEPFCRERRMHILFNVYISQIMNLFVVWKMNTHIIYVYLRWLRTFLLCGR